MKIGIDIIEISRIKTIMAKHKRFLTKNFSQKENAYFKLRNYHPQTVAGNFATKEAYAKALSSGIFRLCLADIEILRNKKNAPILFFKKRRVLNSSVSISHSKDNAIAIVILKSNKFNMSF